MKQYYYSFRFGRPQCRPPSGYWFTTTEAHLSRSKLRWVGKDLQGSLEARILRQIIGRSKTEITRQFAQISNHVGSLVDIVSRKVHFVDEVTNPRWQKETILLVRRALSLVAWSCLVCACLLFWLLLVAVGCCWLLLVAVAVGCLVVCMFACLLICLFACLLVCWFAGLLVCLLGWLVGCN
jgi:hypothetical protein